VSREDVGVPLFVDWDKKIIPMPHVSPSSASYLIDEGGCNMRVLLNYWKNSPERSIPSSGATEIGNITHRLYDRSSKLNSQGESPADEWGMKEARREFQALVREEEDKLSKCPVNNFLLPLSDMSDFSNKQAKACQVAVEYRKNAMKRSNGSRKDRNSGPSGPRLSGSEVVVWDSRRKIEGDRPEEGDFSVKGSIDYVSISEGSYEILDYKTGKIVNDDGSVKREYEVQILLYSAMLRMTSIQAGIPRKVSKGILKHAFSSESRVVELGLDREDCLLDTAVTGLEEINRIVNDSQSADEITENLANPGLEACRFCDFRAVCTPFHDSLPQWMVDSEDEIRDVIGTIHSVPMNSRPGSKDFQFKLEDSRGRIWLIEGVHSGRYPAIEDANIGDSVAVFNGRTSDYNVPGFHRKFKANKRNHAFFVGSQ
jgi:hypothetical protein